MIESELQKGRGPAGRIADLPCEMTDDVEDVRERPKRTSDLLHTPLNAP